MKAKKDVKSKRVHVISTKAITQGHMSITDIMNIVPMIDDALMTINSRVI
jgi:hypothetical protein